MTMKLTYKNQIIVSMAIMLIASIINTIAKHWIFVSAGFAVCGLLWITHPVLPKNAEVSKKSLLWVRIAGLVLILIGALTRLYG